MRGRIGRSGRAAPVGEGELFDGGRPEADRDVAVARGGACVGVGADPVDHLIEAGAGEGIGATGRDGGCDQSGAVDRERLDGTNLVLERAAAEIDIEKREGNVAHPLSIERAEVDRDGDGLGLISQVHVQDERLLHRTQPSFDNVEDRGDGVPVLRCELSGIAAEGHGDVVPGSQGIDIVGAAQSSRSPGGGVPVERDRAGVCDGKGQSGGEYKNEKSMSAHKGRERFLLAAGMPGVPRRRGLPYSCTWCLP